jgi:hypothetical protein
MSAALFGDTLRAWSVADRLPELWLNPWAKSLLHQSEPFPTATTEDGVNLDGHAPGNPDCLRTERRTGAASSGQFRLHHSDQVILVDDTSGCLGLYRDGGCGQAACALPAGRAAILGLRRCASNGCWQIAHLRI